ncbi:PREDICTED: uncharacterized protein LOC109476868 [Branchiostoma belcheri]|uniref:Uncharacterized protein LOC109476868 n=1 Tax=Branchiostoma belcheri TaxID=7741 RepID=A0A6P4Z9V8_BRABE|nr:PREDICTED: uncharacterized protein LOC109476868 [Branchiostoma belcheri]
MTSTVELDFHSNHVFTYEGFWIRFYTKDKPENVEWIHHLLEEAGSFHSKNYPHSYRNNLYQEWSISLDVGKHIRRMFTYFDVQVTEECDSDYLIIEDPLSLDEMHHCGTCIPTPYISVGHTLHVFVVTDFAIYRTGFSAKYESVQDRSGNVEPSASDVLPSDWLTIGDKIKQISVSTSTNQVWALDIDGKPLRRTGISQSTPQGTGWEVVGTEQFLYISVGRVGVWAVSDDSTVMYRKGTFRGAGTAGTSWQAVHIDSKITSSLFNFKTFPVEIDWRGHNIDQIHSGKDFVWIVASYPHFTYGYTIVRKGITSDNPEGTSWDSVQTANMKEVSVSSRTGQLWAVEIGGRVWRSPFYCEISVKSNWEAIEGCFSSVSVGRSGVWAVDFEGEVYHRAGTFLNETAPEKRLCAEDEVICPYSEKCIKECRVCDGIVDCGDDDDTDERNCWFANCPEKHRRVCAGEVGCYSPTRVCDGERNCGEITEDERDCPDSCVHHWKRNYLLQRDEIQCRDLSGCVKITKVCDGQKDCADGSDEINCYDFCSLHGTFGDAAYWKCRDSPGCVKGEFLGNGISDCADGSDEENCDELCRSIGYWPCKISIPPFPRCIKGSGRCNRAVECRDFSDEIGCGTCDGYWAALEEYKEKRREEGLTTSDEYNYKCNSGKCATTFNLCDDRDFCGNWEDEQDCDITTCMDTAVRFGVSDQYKEIEVAQNCDGKDDCRTGVDENPRRCDIGACLLPVDLLVKDYIVTEGFGARHLNHGSLGLSLTEWVVDNIEDWLQITLEHPVQLAAIVVSGPRSSHPPPFTLKYGLGTDCLTTYIEAGEIKVFQTSKVSANSAEHYLAIAVHTRVVMLTPQSALDKTVLNVGLLGCPIKEQRFNDKFCGKGWTMFEESCYRIISSPLVWWAAERYCQALGGHLAAVNTLRENEFLRSNTGNGWIGLKLDSVVMKKQRERIKDLTWSNGSPAGDAFKEENIALDAFQEYLWRLNDPLCATLELHDPSSHSGDNTNNTTQCVDGDHDLAETQKGDLNANVPDMTVCDDCMARETSCGNIRCGLPDDYRCGLIYSPGYPAAFPPSAICLWTIDGPKGSFVTLLLLDVDLPGYSSGVCTSRVLQVRDRFLTVGWNTIHGLCRGEDEQKVYVSSSNDMQLAMLATSNSADIGGSRGFMATFNISTFSPSRQVHNLPDDAGFICPCGWHLFRRNCYQTFRQTVPLNWVESDLKCREYGANLTSVSDRQEMEFLHVLLVTNVVVKRTADPKLFIGFYDVYRNRTFVWTDGIPVTYTDW